MTFSVTNMPDGVIVALPDQDPLFIPSELVSIVSDTLLATQGYSNASGLDFDDLEDLMRPDLTLIDGGKKDED